MNSLAQDMKTKLISAEVGSSTPSNEWGIHIGTLPSKPDNAILLLDGGGGTPVYLMDCDTLFDEVCTIRVRSKDYLSGYSKIRSVINALALSTNTEIDGTSYWSIMEMTSPTHIGQDDQNRDKFIANLSVRRSE